MLRQNYKDRVTAVKTELQSAGENENLDGGSWWQKKKIKDNFFVYVQKYMRIFSLFSSAKQRYAPW